MISKTAKAAWAAIENESTKASLLLGDAFELITAIPSSSVDLTVTSPPYCMGKEYEENSDIRSFIVAHEKLLPEIIRVTKPGGSICWQVGNYLRPRSNEIIPLDYLIFDLMRSFPEMKLRNRIVWTFGHGLHCQQRFSGRYETILWFTKGSSYDFDLDAVRVPQKYPGKRSAKGPGKGDLSGNPLGKNPSDVWDIPNVKSNHIEKTEHPCQFPVALVQRLVRALCPADGLLLDPFCGVGSSGVAALIEGRRFIGSELTSKYVKIAQQRLDEAEAGRAKTRPMDLPVLTPRPTHRNVQKPEHFWPNESALAEPI